MPASTMNRDSSPPARAPNAPAEPAHAPNPAEPSLPIQIAAPVQRFDAYLLGLINGLALPSNLKDALRYSALGPGKRVRPLLTWHSFCAIAPAGSDPAACLPAAAAVELVHAFSLVHDDLPGIDNDDLRRGRPTLHRHTTEAMAILAGDSLLTLSFGVLFDAYSPAVAATLARELAAGTNAMIAGQVYDTLGGFEPGLSDEQKLELIHLNKTGALISAACRMGVIVASSINPSSSTDPAVLNSITTYANAIGLMFQVVDDLLDVTQSTQQLGKTAGKDATAGKLTYPAVLGLARSRDKVRQLHAQATRAVQSMGSPASPLVDLADFIAVRTR